MKSYTDRTQEKTKRVADSISMPKNSGGAAFQFVDNRTAAVAQHKMTEAINTSPKQAAQGQQLHSLFGNTAQMQPLAEDELQMKTASKVLQKTGPEEEELLQGKFGTAPIQREPDAKPNSTGLPDNLKAGIENLSGFSMDDVKVHYNSPKPAQLQAHAYAQGTDIHLASGQEKHLPHEAWHVVQQRQGRVKPTLQMKTGIPVNDDPHLEKEADVMGGRAAVQAKAGLGRGFIGSDPLSGVVANSTAQKGSNVRQGFGFVDNRPVAVMQKKLQETANKSMQAVPLMSFQKMTNISSQTNKVNLIKGNDVVQRVVDRASSTESNTGNYIIPNDDKKILYSKINATDPVPASLYIPGNDVTNDLIPINLNSWTPNVRLFSDMERGEAQTNRTQTVPSDAFCGLAACFGSTMQVPQHDLEDGMIGRLRANITGLRKAPTTGLIGKNDCGEFANQLQNLIGVGNDRPALPGHRGPLETQVGDKMKHTLTDPNDCPYHYATIVAADGVSKVTLEANAGKSLSAPEFFIRGGIRGFMRDNNEDYDNGRDHTITRLSSKTQEESRQALDRQKLNQPAYRTTGGRKITDTVSEI